MTTNIMNDSSGKIMPVPDTYLNFKEPEPAIEMPTPARTHSQPTRSPLKPGSHGMIYEPTHYRQAVLELQTDEPVRLCAALSWSLVAHGR
jgi:hypothetical protein